MQGLEGSPEDQVYRPPPSAKCSTVTPRGRRGGQPHSRWGSGRLTKASLALLKAFISCGDRDMNWAKWQSLAPGRVLRGVGTGAAPVLVSTVVISISTSVHPTAKSVLRKDGQMRDQRVRV